ncbi:hypothetical protein [Desulforegula conservatrix]|uniref:hypothetical protein n=1 Tax=Desulforegula conservatrix TaxID=153026 RepID=UPI0004084009|nr:hypothetical protein [Desulforegula conservatrix]
MNIAPVFDFSALDDKVPLHKGQAEIEIKGQVYQGECEVFFNYLPHTSIDISGKFNGVPFNDSVSAMTDPSRFTSLMIDGKKIEGFALGTGGSHPHDGIICVDWCSSSEPICIIGDDSTLIKKVIFHLFNFKDFGRVGNLPGQLVNISQISLNSDEWKVRVESLEITPKNKEFLKTKGGNRITHVGTIEKNDGSLFTGEQADQFLEYLNYFFTFANGYWCNPVCPVGFDENDNRVWASWSSPMEPYIEPLSWFAPRYKDQLEELFPLFIKKIQNEEWSKALSDVISWYHEANNAKRGIPGCIIMAQAAIERLSFEYAVKYKKLLTVKGFKELWASDKLRLLFSSLNIPIDIPNEDQVLKTIANQHNLGSAPHAITEIRNSLVHPEHKKQGQFTEAYFETWDLFLWYLEIGILAVCGYSGTYRNRLILGRPINQVDPVPYI